MADVIGILLAAGASTRFGRPKLLAPLPNGRPIAEAAARSLCAALPTSVAVVRPSDHDLHALIHRLGLRTLINPHPELGMGYSLALGVQAYPDAAGWVIALADMPYIRATTVRGVVDALADGAPLVAPRHEGRRGHPVGFSHSFYQDLACMRGDFGAREILDLHPGDLRLIDVEDPGIHLDIDSPEDLSWWQPR